VCSPLRDVKRRSNLGDCGRSLAVMGKDLDLIQAVREDDLPAVMKILNKLRVSRSSESSVDPFFVLFLLT